jgi:hypothetical protein
VERLKNLFKKYNISPEDSTTYSDEDPRNMLANAINPYLDNVGIQIPKLSQAERKEQLNKMMSPEGAEELVMGMGIGGINKVLPKSKLDFSKVNPEEFLKTVDNFRNSSEMASANIHPYSIDDYKNMITKLSQDKNTGYALKNDGELVSVFSKQKGRGSDLVNDAVNSGAKKLDAYDINGKLPELYGDAGFKEISRSPFNPEYADKTNSMLMSNKPDFVEMSLPLELQNSSKVNNFAPLAGLANYLKKQQQGN